MLMHMAKKSNAPEIDERRHREPPCKAFVRRTQAEHKCDTWKKNETTSEGYTNAWGRLAAGKADLMKI